MSYPLIAAARLFDHSRRPWEKHDTRARNMPTRWLGVVAPKVVHPARSGETRGCRPRATRAEAPDEHPQECARTISTARSAGAKDPSQD